MKKCSKCKCEKELTEFYYRTTKGIRHPDYWCKACCITNSKNQPKYETKCNECGLITYKRADFIKRWSGLCRTCSNKESSNRPEIKAKQSERAREQVIRQGGIPNANKFIAGKLKEDSPNWKGGLPKCIDCGKELSEYACKRCTTCFTKHIRGENHWNWKGGVREENVRIRKSPEYRQWRKDVFQRDGWTCVKCGYKSKLKSDIRADHIKPFSLFPELRLDVSNGRTLCLKCDAIHGYNHNRDKHTYDGTSFFEVSRSIN